MCHPEPTYTVLTSGETGRTPSSSSEGSSRAGAPFRAFGIRLNLPQESRYEPRTGGAPNGPLGVPTLKFALEVRRGRINSYPERVVY